MREGFVATFSSLMPFISERKVHKGSAQTDIPTEWITAPAYCVHLSKGIVFAMGLLVLEIKEQESSCEKSTRTQLYQSVINLFTEIPLAMGIFVNTIHQSVFLGVCFRRFI